MCYEAWEPVFICTTEKLDSSTSLLVEALLKSNKRTQSHDIPLSENILHNDLLHNLLGMYVVAYYNQGPWTVQVNSS